MSPPFDHLYHLAAIMIRFTPLSRWLWRKMAKLTGQGEEAPCRDSFSGFPVLPPHIIKTIWSVPYSRNRRHSSSTRGDYRKFSGWVIYWASTRIFFCKFGTFIDLSYLRTTRRAKERHSRTLTMFTPNGGTIGSRLRPTSSFTISWWLARFNAFHANEHANLVSWLRNDALALPVSSTLSQ